MDFFEQKKLFFEAKIEKNCVQKSQPLDSNPTVDTTLGIYGFRMFQLWLLCFSQRTPPQDFAVSARRSSFGQSAKVRRVKNVSTWRVLVVPGQVVHTWKNVNGVGFFSFSRTLMGTGGCP